MGVYFKGYEISNWQINKSYSIGSVVKYNNKEYVAIKDVPVGINIGMNEYWMSEDIETRLSNLESDVEDIDDYVQGLSIDDLTDVNITDIEDGDILIYNEQEEMFVPTARPTSENEVFSPSPVKIGTYNDGTNDYDVYRDVLEYTETSSSYTAKDISNLNIKKVLDISGVITRNNSGTILETPINSYESNGNFNWVRYDETNKQLQWVITYPSAPTVSETIVLTYVKNNAV